MECFSPGDPVSTCLTPPLSLSGVLLSGGLDSSLVAAVASRHLGQSGGMWGRLHSFCIGLNGSPDLAAARKVADFLKTDHHEFTFTVQVGGRERCGGRTTTSSPSPCRWGGGRAPCC